MEPYCAVRIWGRTDRATSTVGAVFKWGHKLAATARAECSHGFRPDWDFEMAAIAFGEELELELRYIDPSVGELLNPATTKTLQDFEAQRTQTVGLAEAA